MNSHPACMAFRPHRHFHPRFEALEGRFCPSVTVTSVALGNGTNELKIQGDSAADIVNIVDQGDGNVAVTDGASLPIGSPAMNVSRIRFDGHVGTDTVNYTLANSLTHDQSLRIRLGSGGDGTAALDLAAGVSGAKLDADVEGNSGADTISATVGDLSAGAHVSLDIDGGRGNDKITLTSAATGGTTANVSADSSLYASVAGDKGDDTLATTFAGQILGRFHYTGDGGPGTDTITDSVTVNDGSTGKVLAKDTGGRGTDTVSLDVTDNSGGAGNASALAALDAAIVDRGDKDTTSTTTPDTVKIVTSEHHHGWGWGDGDFSREAHSQALANVVREFSHHDWR